MPSFWAVRIVCLLFYIIIILLLLSNNFILLTLIEMNQFLLYISEHVDLLIFIYTLVLYIYIYKLCYKFQHPVLKYIKFTMKTLKYIEEFC